MHKLWILGLGFGLGAGCFSPDETPELNTDGGATGTSGGPDTTSETPGSTQGPETTATGSSGTTADPTGTPSTTVDPTAEDTGTDTGIGDRCADSEDCASGVCVGLECVPCGDAAEPDAACAEADSATPVCSEDGSSCVACTAGSCDGSAPACDPTLGCVACTEHSQCPDSACHLSGPDAGSCFDTADVVEVSDSEELQQEFVQGNPGGQLVIRLTPGTIQISGGLVSDLAEVALIGSNSTITGGATALFFNIPDLFYVAGVTLEDGPSRAISCSAGEELWLDDTSISDYPIALLSSCDVFVRRSQFRGNPGGPDFGGTLQLGGSFRAVNSDFGPAADPVMDLQGGDVDVRYSTFAGNQTAISCGSPSSGQIRNSILTSVGTSVDTACGLSYIDNAVDQGFLGGTVVPSYDPSWFAVSDGSRFFLSPSGEETFEGIADWDEGDPIVDIEGDPRPQDTPGFPGVDEP